MSNVEILVTLVRLRAISGSSTSLAMLGRIARFLYRHLIDDPRDHDQQPQFGETVLEPPRQETAALQQRVRQLEEMVLAKQALYLQQVFHYTASFPDTKKRGKYRCTHEIN